MIDLKARNIEDVTAAVRDALQRGGGQVSEDELTAAVHMVVDSLIQGLLASLVIMKALDLSFVNGRLHYELNEEGRALGLDSVLEGRHLQ